MRQIEYTVTPDYDGRPLIHFLKEHICLSTRIIQTLRHTYGSVLVNGTHARVVDRITAGDTVTINLPEKTSPPPLWETELSVIFEDDDLLVVNKPSGISVHPTYNHPNGTLCNAVAAYMLNKYNEPSAARAVGRLDKVTSGVMIFAKNKFIASRLNGNMEKIYNAVATGTMNGSGTVDAPIYRPDMNKTNRAVGNRGDNAVTHWKSLYHSDNKSFLEITTETGRTHQIRVHLAHIGHPLAGDEMYGGKATENLTRAALHCKQVSLTNPITNEFMTFTAPLPEDMKKELEKSGFAIDNCD